MKPNKIKPVWASIFGVFIAPVTCGLNAVLMAMAVGQANVSTTAIFLMAMLGTFLLCFPLALLSESIIKRWQSGAAIKARWLSASCGAGALFCLASLTSTFTRKEQYILFAALLLPFLWSLLFLLFAVFARPPKP